MSMDGYSTVETSPGIWCIHVELPGNVAMIKLDGGILPEGFFRPYPKFTSKEEAEGFLRGIEFSIGA